MGLLPMGFDILPPSDDRIFKLILTSPEAESVLLDLIAATIKRPVMSVFVRSNELPPGDTDEKAERFDVNCTLDDGTQVDLEMQASSIQELGGGHQNLIGKSVYYLSDLHSSQTSKGKRYDELADSYQVTYCSYTVFPHLPDYINPFSMRHNITGEPLTDALNVIYVELSKLSEILKKSVGDMTDLEKWAVFFRYASVPEYRETVNKVIESKEALQMAGDLLMSVSQSERERAIFRSRRMYQSDKESDEATILERGRRQGVVEGKAEGRAEGELAKAVAIARNMRGVNMPVTDISKLTGLSTSEIERL